MVLFNVIKVKPTVVSYPTYGEVFVDMTPKEIHNAFIAVEVLYTETSDKVCKNNARLLLENIAGVRNWDFDTFVDIIVEEYSCLHDK